MNKASVVIITGSNMKNISNKNFNIEVPPGCDHEYILEEFIVENKIIYPYFDYCFAHDAVKLAVMDNIVLLLGSFINIVALPDIITRYQNESLKLYRNIFLNDKSLFSIMSIHKKDGKIIYEGIDSSRAKCDYDSLVKKKLLK